MAKRIPKSAPPDSIGTAYDPSAFEKFCEVCVPLSPQVFTYAADIGSGICRGSVVWVQLAHRRPCLGLALRVSFERPPYQKIKKAFPHASGYVFGERYLEKLEWTARYYLSTPMQALNVFWPKDFSKYLDALSMPAESLASPGGSPVRDGGTLPPLTDDQSKALDRLRSLLLDRRGFRGALLHGVTGSGKTRVYMELAKIALDRGMKVLVLVPEIGLAPQTAKRFSDFFGSGVPVIHSALSAPDKRNAWVSVFGNRADILIGTRSAILSPFPFDLAILDEEHDASYKQEDLAPRYHAKSIAFHEALKEGGLVVLGSATPSLETYFAAKNGKLEYIALTRRATDVSLPQVRLIDMKKKARKQDSSLLLSTELREALSRTVHNGDQAIVLMNRRGYSKERICAECGAVFSCPTCKVPLVYHRQYGGLLCHYCGRLFPLNMPCPSCGSTEYELVGGAIEKLEEEIREWIPEASVVRMDRDTTQNVGAAEMILSDFRDRKYSVLLGTQIVAKGHDFPGVQLVGVVGADSGSGAPDFRAGERLFELLSQTSGRAGRTREGGLVLLQTNNPESPIIRFAVAHDYAGFAESELAARAEAHYPPFSKVATLEIGHRDGELLHRMANDFADALAKHPELEVLGPVDAYIPQVRGVYWMNLLVKASSAAVIRRALQTMPSELDIRINVDA